MRKIYKRCCCLFALIFILFETTFAQVPSYVPTVGLKAYYPFDGDANDYSGNGNNAVEIFGGVSFVTGKIGQAAKFGGYSNPGHIRVSNSPSLQFSTEASFAVWVRLDNFAGEDMYANYSTNGTHAIIAKNHDNNQSYHEFLLFNNQNKLVSWAGTNTGLSSGYNGLTSNYSLGQWVHLVYVYSPTSSSIYFNGILDTTFSTVVNFSNANSQDLYFGKFSDSWYPLNGAIDEALIYNRALTACEIWGIYSGLASQNPIVNLGNDTTLIQGSTLTLNAGNAGSSYQWSTGATAQQINVTTTGTYWVKVTNAGGCYSMDTINVNFNNCSLNQLPLNLQQGLVAYYPFCGNANDISPNGNNGTVYGATLTNDRFGNPNSAYSFNGINNYISRATFPDMTSLSVSVWVNHTNGSNISIVFCEQDITNGNDFYMGINDSSVGIRADKSGAQLMLATCLGGQPPQALTNVSIENQWTHIVWVMFPDSSQIFLNGTLAGVYHYTGSNVGYHGPAYFGKFHDGYYDVNYFKGKIDDFGIWNRTLTPCEVMQLYTGLPQNPPIVNLSNDTSLAQGNSLTLNAGNAGSTYQWSTGDATQQINVTTTGTYWVKVTSAGGCYSMDTINVSFDTTQYFINDCQNLDNNQIPQGWSLSEWIPTSNLSNGRLNAFIVDADGRLSKTGVIPNNTDSLILEWDGGVYYAYWGMYTGIVLTYNNNKNIEINHGSGYSWFGSGNKDFSDFSFYRGTGQTVLWGNDLNTLILPYDTTIFHYTVTVTNSFIKIKVNNLISGIQSFSTSYLFSVYDSISDFNLANVQKITFLVHCTTDNSNWLDNPCIKIYTHNNIAPPVVYIGNDTTICKGSSITYKANAPTTTGTWEYNQDFENTIGSEWSDTTIFTFNNTKVLGPFSAHTVNLNLSNLPAHDSVEVSFDLYIHDSWDGNGTTGIGLDFWRLKVNNDTIINTTFANNNIGSGVYETQSYPQNFPAVNPPETGVFISNLPVRCSNWASTLYKIVRKMNSINNNIQIKFIGAQQEDICNESWSMDNVKVKLFTTDTATHYLWSTGDTTQVITVTPAQTTTYVVIVTKGTTVYKDTATVYVMNPQVNLGSDTTICKGDSVKLIPNIISNTGICSKSQLPTNLQQGLVAFYPFCGNANDESGNVNNGTVHGATLTTDRFGNPNSAYNFDGVSNYIDAPDNSVLNIQNSITLTSWIKTTNPHILADQESGQVVAKHFTVSKRAYDIDANFTIEDSIRFVIFEVGDALGNEKYATVKSKGQNTYNDTWHLLVGTYDYSSGYSKIYIDGNLINSNYIGQKNLEQTTVPLTIGCYLAGVTTHRGYYHGSIDDVSIYNRALSASEVSQLYNDGNITSYHWSTGDTTQSITVSPNQTTNYSLTVTNSAGCSASDTITVNVVNIDAGSDVTICQGDSTQLNASGGLIYTWTPTTGLSNPNIANPIAKPTQTTTYYVSAQSQGPNLIYNGNFELGNLGFTSNYIYTPPPNLTENEYWVSTNAQAWNGGMAVCGDHTSGSGNMMFVNGAPTPNTSIFCETVNVKPNTNYAFSTWLMTLTAQNPAQLQFSINGVLLGNIFTANSSTCIWDRFYQTWYSDTNTTATICIVDQNTQTGGNDFAIDDIYFSELHVCGDSVVVTVAPLPQAYIGSDTTICKGDIVKLTYSTTICGKSQLPTNLQQGLVAFYPFCGNANDESGNGNNGIVNGATLTTDRFGNTNSAYSFDGVSNYISVSNSTGLSSLINQATISGWVYSIDGAVCMICKSNNSMLGDYRIQNGISGSSFIIDGKEYYFNYNFVINQWEHIAVTYLNDTAKLYVNGNLVATTATVNTTFSINQNTNLEIGRDPWGNIEYHNGKLDDYLIYNRALSTNEIQQLYSLGSSASSSLLWSTGDTTQSITVSPNQTTNYSLTVTNSAGCSASDTITVNVIPLPEVNLGNDTTICKGDSILLNSGLTVGNTLVCDKSMLPSNLQQGLVAFYPFCGNANDESGNGINGTVIGNVNLCNDRFGNLNSAYTFGGTTNDYIDFGTSSVNQLTNQITISAWVNYTQNAGTYSGRILSNGGNNSSGRGYEIFLDNPLANPPDTIRKIGFYWANSSLWSQHYIHANQWQNIVVSATLSNILIYIDGILDTSITTIVNGFNYIEPFNIGRKSAWAFDAIGGKIDDISIYNRVLSAFEVNQLYTLGNYGATCHWSTGDTTQTIKVSPNQTTTYSVNVTNSNGCSASDSIKVNVAPLPIVNLGNDTAFCMGNTLNLNAGNSGSTYLWQDNSTNQIYNVNQQGTYWVKVTTPIGCKSSDTISVVYNPAPVVNLGNDTAICQGETLLLDATLTNATYLWLDGSTNATFNVSSQGTYWVKVTNSNGCTATDSIHVTLTPLVVNIGNDTTICQGNNVTLDAGNAGATYVWSTGVATQQINVNSSGVYWVNITNGNCFNSDTININVIPKPLVNLGNDTTICHLGSITLNAGNAGSTYLWNTNATTQQINVSTNGNYWVKVNNNGCVGGDTINISFIPLNVNIGNDTTICEGDNITLNAANTGSAYLWNTGVATQTISAGTAGNYWVNVTNGNCTGSDTININVAQKPIVNLGNDTIMCPGDLVVLSAGAGFSSYLWSDGSTQPTLNVNNPGTYTVTVSNSGCKATDQIVIAECNSDIWVPNVFTPNGDGKNDTFHPVCTNITDISMYIYNRWGNQIYEGTGATLEWDGKYQGTTCPDGVYYFLIKYTQKDNGHTTQKQLHGSVTLLK